MDSISFVGTATTLIRLGSFTLLTDPNFLHRGQRAYLGKGLWSRRLTEPAMQPADLPALDAVVLSHLHGDHFDRIARRELDHTVPLVTTEQAAGRLSRHGFAAHGLPVWDTYQLTRGEESLTIESLPGIHARGVLGKLLPPVMGSLLIHQVGGQVRRRVYLTGDTLTGDHLDEIRERHPDIDVAVVHLGGTRILFATVTMDAAQGLDFLHRVRPRTAVPVHYDDYTVFRSPLSEFLSLVGHDEEDWRIETPARGETVELPQQAARPLRPVPTGDPEPLGVRYLRGPDGGPEVRLTWRLDCGPELIWPALTDPALLSEWLGPTRFSDTEFGVFRIRCFDDGVERTGVVVTCDSGVSFQVRWIEPPDQRARLSVELAPAAGGTLLMLTHHDVPRTLGTSYQELWQQRLRRLTQHLGVEGVPATGEVATGRQVRHVQGYPGETGDGAGNGVR
jgi:L-ascorbate metabolism protein UlaG (beta-lactamase superfamily)/uncharacterized protein YndB with AHSA1/START domain